MEGATCRCNERATFAGGTVTRQLRTMLKQVDAIFSPIEGDISWHPQNQTIC